MCGISSIRGDVPRSLITWITKFQEALIDRWLEQVRKEGLFPDQDIELRAFFQAWLSGSIRLLERPGDADYAVMLNLLTEQIDRGIPLSSLIEADLLFVQAVGASDLPTVGLTEANKSQISSKLIPAWLQRSANIFTVYVDQISQNNRMQSEMTASMLRVAKSANLSLELDTVLKIIAEELNKALGIKGSQRVKVFIMRDKPEYRFVVEPPTDFSPYPPSQFTRDAFRLKEIQYCYDAAKEPRCDQTAVKKFRAKSLLAVPFVSQGEVLAAALINPRTYRRFTHEELELVSGIANSAAMAINNARLLEASKEIAIISERERLSMELHDRIAQNLGAMRLNMISLSSKKLSESERKVIAELREAVDETYNDLRDCIFSLRAFPDDERPFGELLKEYTCTFTSHNNLQIDYNLSNSHLELLSDEAKLQAGRIIQEALCNVRKHAHATKITLDGKFVGAEYIICIKDDGIGFNMKNPKVGPYPRFGLEMMAERARSVGGKLSVQPCSDGGTCVYLDLPLRMQA